MHFVPVQHILRISVCCLPIVILYKVLLTEKWIDIPYNVLIFQEL